MYARGQSEEIIGRALARGRRDDVALATKFRGIRSDNLNYRRLSRRWIIREVEDTLRRLKTDWIGLYQAHRPEAVIDIEQTLSALDDLVHAGKVRYIGSSAFPASQIVEAQVVTGVTTTVCSTVSGSRASRGARMSPNATASDALTSVAERPKATMLIDTDVHELWNGVEDVLPYMDPVWRHHLKDPGWRWYGSAIDPMPYLAPITGTRAEWAGDKVGVNHAIDATKTAQHLFEDEGVTTAILNGSPSVHFSKMKTDFEFAAALAAAYNDWQIEHWLERDARFCGSVHVIAHVPEAAAREIDRVAEHPGIVQVFLPLVNDRQYGDPFYRPIFEAAARNGLAVTLHHGSGTTTILGHPRSYIEWHTLAGPQAAMGQLTSLLFNGVFDLFPNLKVALLETGVGWVPWMMGRADQQYRELRTSVPWVKRLPSEHIRDSVRVSTQPVTEMTAREFGELIERHRLERVYLFATDYPHYDADSASVLDGLPETTSSRIRYENALESFPRLAGRV